MNDQNDYPYLNFVCTLFTFHLVITTYTKKWEGETIVKHSIFKRDGSFVYFTVIVKSFNSEETFMVKSLCFVEEMWVMSLSYANSRGWYVLENTCK